MNTHQLIFELTPFSISISELQGTNATQKATLLFSGKTEHEMKGELTDFFQNQSFLNSYTDYSLSWVSDQSVLIPMSIFKNEYAATFFETCFVRKSLLSSVSYNVIQEKSLVNVFEIPSWITPFFVRKFPRIVILHGLTSLIRGEQDYPGKGHFVHLAIYKQFVYILIKENHHIQFSNSFSYKTADDVLYYTSFVLKQESLSVDMCTLKIHLAAECNNDITTDFIENWNLISDFKQINRLPITPNSLVKHHLSCV
jgi:hypothetical protein